MTTASAQTYLILRSIRLFCYGAFLLALLAANAWKGDETKVGTIARFAPPLFLLLALGAGLAERLYRLRHGIAPKRFIGAPH